MVYHSLRKKSYITQQNEEGINYYEWRFALIPFDMYNNQAKMYFLNLSHVQDAQVSIYVNNETADETKYDLHSSVVSNLYFLRFCNTFSYVC